MKHLVLAMRLIFGAWMVLNGLNHFLLDLYPAPSGATPLAAQLMDALINSRLYDVAIVFQLVTGALILSGFLVPIALAVIMPISTCALYWALILDHQPVNMLLALIAFALNGLLMLAYIDYYRGVLQRRTLSLGEA